MVSWAWPDSIASFERIKGKLHLSRFLQTCTRDDPSGPLYRLVPTQACDAKSLTVPYGPLTRDQQRGGQL